MSQNDNTGDIVTTLYPIKQGDTRLMAVTQSNLDRFSKLFNC